MNSPLGDADDDDLGLPETRPIDLDRGQLASAVEFIAVRSLPTLGAKDAAILVEAAHHLRRDRGLRDALEGVSRFFNTSGEQAGLAAIFEQFGRQSRPRTEPETAGETGDGVWAIYTVDDAGGAHIEQVYPTELDALRANKGNTDPTRKVRFLPYGIAVSVLDTSE